MIFSKGSAIGGFSAAADALRLWAKCAIGGADYSMLAFNSAQQYVRLQAAKAGFEAAVEAVTTQWNADRDPAFQLRWRSGAREGLAKAAGHLLAACREIERDNAAHAVFDKFEHVDDIIFMWWGVFTPGRRISASLVFGEQLAVSLAWDTGTGKESSYLGLPSMTNEAETSENRREGGWAERK